MQFLGRKKPIFGDFWTFLIIFGFELMPASASLWYLGSPKNFGLNSFGYPPMYFPQYGAAETTVRLNDGAFE